jgi:hypothetical protein
MNTVRELLHLATWLHAMYQSEGWYVLWEMSPTRRRIYYKARSVVVFDRCLNEGNPFGGFNPRVMP